jgi:hypothetical protein
MKVGDLVKVVAKDLRTSVGKVALVTRVEERKDSSGVIVQYWAQMAESGHSYWFRRSMLEVINASR